MYYINQKQKGITETVDQFETHKEAYEMLQEYRIAFNWIKLWISTRATKEWRDS